MNVLLGFPDLGGYVQFPGWLPEVEGDPMALAFAHESLKCAVVETHLKRPGFGGMIGPFG